MRNLRTEQEIMANWKGDLSKPVVSVCCIAYMHELYIEDALEGFLIQETDFPFEIIIHDDASTDRTAEIVREYAAKYPNLIKPILQTENQYSKNIHLPSKNTWNQAKGEYIALCEGDDYWVSSNKLQLQAETMKKFDTNLSFHRALRKCQDNSFADVVVPKLSDDFAQVSINKALIGGGGLMPTASIIVKKETVESLPNWFYTTAPVGDFYLQVIAVKNSNAIFIPELMSVYRICQDNNWTSSMSDIEKLRNVIRKHINSHQYLKNDLSQSSISNVNNSLSNVIFSFLKNTEMLVYERQKIFTEYKEYFSLKQKLTWYLILRFKFPAIFARKIKNLLWL